MARHDLEALILSLRDTKGDDGRIVPCYVVAMTSGQHPRAALIETGEAGVLELLLHIGYCIKCIRAVIQKMEQLLIHFLNIHFSILTICIKHVNYSRTEYVLFVKIIL